MPIAEDQITKCCILYIKHFVDCTLCCSHEKKILPWMLVPTKARNSEFKIASFGCNGMSNLGCTVESCTHQSRGALSTNQTLSICPSTTAMQLWKGPRLLAHKIPLDILYRIAPHTIHSSCTVKCTLTQMQFGHEQTEPALSCTQVLT